MSDAKNPTVSVRKVVSGWGNISYDLWVHGEFVGNYRLQADARKAALERLRNLEETRRQEAEDFNLEFGGE